MGPSVLTLAAYLLVLAVLATLCDEQKSQETEVHISAQEDVVYVGDDVTFVCTVRASDASKTAVNWFMYEQDVTGEPFAVVQTSQGEDSYSSTLTIKKAQFNYTSMVRCKVRLDEERVFHLSTPMTITQRLEGGKKLIGEPCVASSECELEHSVCREPAAGGGARVCQCDDAHPVYSSLEMRCLELAKLEQACVDSAQCAGADNGSQCEEHVCRCRTGYSAESDHCVAKPDASTCQSTSACLDGNAECVEGRCVCKAGHVLNPGSHRCEDSGEQEFQLAIIGVSAVAVLLVLGAVTAACYMLNKRKEAAGTRY
ncbi:uncharacterized protein LOC119440438 [Dermacentor silvarum]|uniref:uncharacterized protein LOC119440438 n=1 Tax=Dermacentor silvarum TaxID=543639 RepID=UPI001896D6D5|nr:uncharacterized protein LOC119440438 [Dermacentor silvarum]